MKDVAGILAEKYGTTAEEIVATGAMKLYLQSMEPAEALRKVRAVYEPKVIMLDSGEGVPVQSNIDGAKYAAFIDESVAFAAQKMRGRGDALAEMVMSKAGREIMQEFKKSAVDEIKELDEKRSA